MVNRSIIFHASGEVCNNILQDHAFAVMILRQGQGYKGTKSMQLGIQIWRETIVSMRKKCVMLLMWIEHWCDWKVVGSASAFLLTW
jgi:hypothetical protein